MGDHTDGRRVRKITRACDRCKEKKLRCSGDKPCNVCAAKSMACAYDSRYGRGRPPTPPCATTHEKVADTRAAIVGDVTDVEHERGPRSESLEPEAEEDVHGQFVDRASGLSFLRRAQKRFSHDGDGHYNATIPILEDSPVMAAGDKPLLVGSESPSIPDRRHAAALLELYFDVCHATYRPLHRPTIKSWHEILQSSELAGTPVHTTIGKAKAAVLLGIFAVSTYHSEKSLGLATNEACLLKSDSYFKAAMTLTDEELGLPKTESVQARLIQVFYLLMTCRMNRAWYVFGNVLQLISALGLHRINSRSETRSDYIATQCRRRVFWTAYILDKYIGTLLGRPMHFHDEDVNIDFPDCVNDEDMTSSGPGIEGSDDCQMDAFVMNARLARIVGKISRKVYPMHALSDRYNVSTLRLLNEELERWRASLPAVLSTVRPSSLVPSFRRQNVALTVAYYHAIMHTNRSSLLRLTSSKTLYSDAYNKSAIQCVHAATEVLKIVDRMAKEGPLFHAFWWTHYVTFCALSVAHVWQVQRQKCSTIDTRLQGEQLSHMMGVCEAHLANATAINSASRRYCIILKELKAEATRAKARQQEQQVAATDGHYEIISEDRDERTRDHIQQDTSAAQLTAPMASPGSVSHTWLDDWTAADWLDLDASAFGLFDNLSPSSLSLLDVSDQGT